MKHYYYSMIQVWNKISVSKWEIIWHWNNCNGKELKQKGVRIDVGKWFSEETTALINTY